jgi:hypothetical protein
MCGGRQWSGGPQGGGFYCQKHPDSTLPARVQLRNQSFWLQGSAGVRPIQEVTSPRSLGFVIKYDSPGFHGAHWQTGIVTTVIAGAQASVLPGEGVGWP